MPLKRIRLELARCKDFPEGSHAHGYDLIAPLDDEGHLNAEEWREAKSRCTVRRFWGDEEEQHGHLRHVGRGWHFHYDGLDTDDDEPLFKLDRHALLEGEYISVLEEDEEMMPFRIVSVRNA